MMHLFVLIVLNVLHIIMLHVCGRRRFLQRFLKFLIILAILIIISFLVSSDRKLTIISNRNNSLPRLYCILLNTQSTHERFIYMSNKTWAKQCDRMGIVKYRKLQETDDEVNIRQTPYHVDLWTRILDTIRQSISGDDIFNNDLLIIVPAPTFIFREKLFLLQNSSLNQSQLPLIIIHEYQEANAYIINGKALNLLRNTELIDSCLQKAYPSAREKHLWKCVQTSLHNEQTDTKCNDNNCFIQYQYDQLTVGHIKNGFCLQNALPMCRTIALLHPVTINDLLTLEFFKYRLKSRSSHDFV